MILSILEQSYSVFYRWLYTPFTSVVKGKGGDRSFNML